MTLWLIRAGSRSEVEQKFLDEGRSSMAWVGLSTWIQLPCPWTHYRAGPN